MKIVEYGNEILTTPTTEVTEFDSDLVSFVESMKTTMKESNGIGLAAPQVGDTRRVCIVNTASYIDGCVLDGKKELTNELGTLVLVNPVYINKSPTKSIMTEGCLSFPEVSLDVKRPAVVEVEYFDETGVKHTLECANVLSRCIQHEIDHLDGVLFHTVARKLPKKQKRLIKNIKDS